MKIGILTLRTLSSGSPFMAEVVRLLADWGATVDLIHPEAKLTDLAHVRVDHDLYLLKSRTDMALAAAGALHAAGAVILNPYPVAALLRDKVFCTSILNAAGVRTPPTYVTARPEQLAPLLDDGPLIIKAYRGPVGRGVHIVWHPDELDDVPANRGPLFAQRYKVHERDCKVYCIGKQVFGVRRVWPPRTLQQKAGEAFAITPEIHDIVTRCGRALGLEMFGMDLIESDGRVYAVDVSSFPSFMGVPDAALRLADYIYTAGQRVIAGEPLLPVTPQPFTQKDVLV